MILDKNEGGFFLEYFNNLRKSLTDNQLNEFGALKNGEERVKFVVRALKTAHVELPVEVCKSESNKSSEVALECKKEGNKAFQALNNHNAINFYTQGILQVPWSDKAQANNSNEQVCVLLANRSAALYHIEQFTAALEDIEELLRLGDYPKNLRYKVLDRKARCLLALEQRLSARETLRATLVALDEAKGLEEARRIKWQMDIQIMISMLEHGVKGANTLRDVQVPHNKGTDINSLSGGAHPKFPAASASLQFEYGGPEHGRLTRAAKPIVAGEVLIVEKPHVVALLREHRVTHCWHCLKILQVHQSVGGVVAYPCYRCSEVSFCSTSCQRAALEGHHGYECRFLPTLSEAGVSITCLLALRVITQLSLQGLKKQRPQLENAASSLRSLTRPGAYRGSDLATFYALETHESSRSPSDLLHRALMATFLLKGLREGGFFGQEPGDVGAKTGELMEDEAFIGALLLHNLQVCQFNAHEVSELVVTELSVLETGYQPETDRVATSVFIGGAVYPTLALFNHSCNPGLVRYFQKGGTVVARAIRGADIGEEVCENYGPIYTREARETRRAKMLEQYWFRCECTACEENWPTYEDMPDMQQSSVRLRCGQCGSGIKVPENANQLAVACSVCGHKTSVLASLAALAGTEQKLESARKKEDEDPSSLSTLQSYLDVLHTLDKFLAPPPIKDLVLCQQAVRRCMMRLGNSVHRGAAKQKPHLPSKQ